MCFEDECLVLEAERFGFGISGSGCIDKGFGIRAWD